MREIDHWTFSFFASWGMYLSILTIGNLFYAVLYGMEIPFIEQYKILKDEKWPWKQDKEEWHKLLKKSIMVVGFNELVIFPRMVYILGLSGGFKTKQAFAIEELPSMWTMLYQYIFMMYGDCVGFSITHRILHHPFFYKRVHKLHHQYNQAIAISATYAHPFEYAFGNLMPEGIPALILGKRLHMYTFLVFTIFRVFGTSNGHSGYEFPWQPWDLLPFRTTVGYHDYHHSGGDH